MSKIKLHSKYGQLFKRDDLVLTGQVPCLLSLPFLPSPLPLPKLQVGTYLGDRKGQKIFQVIQLLRLPQESGQMNSYPLLRCQVPFEIQTNSLELEIKKNGFSLAWITLSDKGASGLRTDVSGPLIPKIIANHLKICFTCGQILPDDKKLLSGTITDLALLQGIDLVITTGGTGVTSRDITPEATLSCIQRRLPGFELAMLQASLQKTPRAVISRAVAGILDRTLIINLPGSPKAVQENLEPILPALKHTLEKINDSPSDCAQE